MSRFNFPPPGRQIYIQAFLDNVRQTGLHTALHRAVQDIPAPVLRSELLQFAPVAGLQVIQGAGVRDEDVFATPSLLRSAPGLLAYYRLLIGISQKVFYSSKTGLNIFKSMEDRQEIRSNADPFIEDLCTELNLAMTVLFQSFPPGTVRDDVMHLPLLTLGAQADGSWRGQIGKKATLGVFEAMKDIVRAQGKPFVTETDASLQVINSAGRLVTLAFAPDPDIVIREEVNNQTVYKTAIEIKGGADYANLHNRVGEAEKSHQKARAAGAQDCWTVISLTVAKTDDAKMARLRQESPATREWIDLTEVLDGTGPYWDRLRDLTISAMGI